MDQSSAHRQTGGAVGSAPTTPEQDTSNRRIFSMEDQFDTEFDRLLERKPDVINKPEHYAKWPIEPATFIIRNGMEFWRGNIVKYATRAGHKTYSGMGKTESEITDLKKIIRYAEMRINQLNGEMTL